MPVYTLTTVTLLTELLLALRENNPNGCKHQLNLDLQELGLDVVDELTRDFLMPLLSEVKVGPLIDLPKAYLYQLSGKLNAKKTPKGDIHSIWFWSF